MISEGQRSTSLEYLDIGRSEGAEVLCGGEVLGEFQTLVNPAEHIPPLISVLTGITDALVAGVVPVGPQGVRPLLIVTSCNDDFNP